MRTDTPGGVPMAAKCSCERRPKWRQASRSVICPVLDVLGVPPAQPVCVGSYMVHDERCPRHGAIRPRPAVFVNAAAFWSMYQ